MPLALGRPVSNSGRLRGVIEQLAATHGWPWTVELVADPDAVLIQPQQAILPPMEHLAVGTAAVVAATADTAILDRGGPWFNLVREVIVRHIPSANMVELVDVGSVGG